PREIKLKSRTLKQEEEEKEIKMECEQEEEEEEEEKEKGFVGKFVSFKAPFDFLSCPCASPYSRVPDTILLSISLFRKTLFEPLAPRLFSAVCFLLFNAKKRILPSENNNNKN